MSISSRYLAEKDLNLRATLDGEAAYRDADFIVIAAPTNYDPLRNYFDTHHIEDVIDLVLNVNPDAVMVIKSTIPVGYCRSLYVKYALKFMTDPSLKGHYFNLLFSPEFLVKARPYLIIWNLRELSWAILKYSPLIKIETGMRRMRQLQLLAIQMREDYAKIFANLLQEGAIKENVPTLFMGMKEAEAVKLFANTYLALRVSYFNELDTYAEVKGLDSQAIINGIGLDPRIGTHYNNPSFGYGGYCLPKDTSNFLPIMKTCHRL